MRITETLFINESELTEVFVRSTGPGGQNVNKVASAVQLRFDVLKSPSLSDEVRSRLCIIAKHLMTKEGILVITAQRFRTQDLNRQDARERLADLIRRVLFKPKKRIPTSVSKAIKKKRLDEKGKTGKLKKSRQKVKENQEV